MSQKSPKTLKEKKRKEKRFGGVKKLGSSDANKKIFLIDTTGTE